MISEMTSNTSAQSSKLNSAVASVSIGVRWTKGAVVAATAVVGVYLAMLDEWCIDLGTYSNLIFFFNGSGEYVLAAVVVVVVADDPPPANSLFGVGL